MSSYLFNARSCGHKLHNRKLQQTFLKKFSMYSKHYIFFKTDLIQKFFDIAHNPVIENEFIYYREPSKNMIELGEKLNAKLFICLGKKDDSYVFDRPLSR